MVSLQPGSPALSQRPSDGRPKAIGLGIGGFSTGKKGLRGNICWSRNLKDYSRCLNNQKSGWAVVRPCGVLDFESNKDPTSSARRVRMCAFSNEVMGQKTEGKEVMGLQICQRLFG